MSGRPLKTLWASIITALLFSTSWSTLALAAGGTGGPAYSGAPGGAGGSGPNGATGIAGTTNTSLGYGGNGSGGGGGGGSGLTVGGTGGSGNANGGSGGTGGIAGIFGTTFSNNAPTTGIVGGVGGGGTTGQSNNASGGGGGGEGGYGAVATGSGTSTNAGSLMGGNGGNGGTGSNGGNGGDGGVGAYLAGAGVLQNNGSINGGTGGTGGNGQGNLRGAGGAGGVGAYFATAGSSLVNTSVIDGGNGGLAGTIGNGGQGFGPGAGGIGVVGSGLTIDNTGGLISGGVGNNGAGARTYALQFTGATNYASYTGTYEGGVNVQAGATFQPALNGSAVGTAMNVGGSAVFASGSTYQVRITPTASDSVAASTATLAGAVKVVAGAGTYAAHEYLILTAPGGYGATRFTGVTSNLPFFTVSLRYDMLDQNVFLDIVGNAVATQPGGVDYRTVAVTQNQRAVASGLTVASNLAGNSGLIFGALNQLTAAQAQAAFDSLSGEGITATQNLAHRSAQMFGDAIFDQTTFYGGGGTPNQITLTDPTPGAGFQALAPRGAAPTSVAPADTLSAAALGLPVRELADLPRPYIAPVVVAPTRTWRAWGSGFGGQEDVRSNPIIGFASQSNQIYGGAVGVDYQVSPNYLAGIAVGGSDGEFNVPNRSTFGSTTGGHVAFYDIARFGAFYGASSSSVSFYQNRTTRNVAGFGGLASETEKGSFSSYEFRNRFEVGRDFAGALGFGGTITPFIALEIASLRTNGFGEQTIAGGPGGGLGLFALNVSGQSTADVPSFVGARFSTAMTLGNGMVLRPVVQAAWVHEFAPYRQQFAGLASLPGATFLVDGARPARDAVQAKAGFELAVGPRTAIFANFDGEFSGASQLYGGKGGLKIAF